MQELKNVHTSLFSHDRYLGRYSHGVSFNFDVLGGWGGGGETDAQIFPSFSMKYWPRIMGGQFWILN